MPPSRRVRNKKGLKSVPGRNPSRGGNRLEASSRFYATWTDANTQTHGAVNPLEQIKVPLPASRPRRQGQLGQAKRTSLAGRMRVCARGSCVPLCLRKGSAGSSHGARAFVRFTVPVNQQHKGSEHIGGSGDQTGIGLGARGAYRDRVAVIVDSSHIAELRCRCVPRC